MLPHCGDASAAGNGAAAGKSAAAAAAACTAVAPALAPPGLGSGWDAVHTSHRALDRASSTLVALCEQVGGEFGGDGGGSGVPGGPGQAAHAQARPSLRRRGR